jgi:hypothetical protein
VLRARFKRSQFRLLIRPSWIEWGTEFSIGIYLQMSRFHQFRQKVMAHGDAAIANMQTALQHSPLISTNPNISILVLRARGPIRVSDPNPVARLVFDHFLSDNFKGQAERLCPTHFILSCGYGSLPNLNLPPCSFAPRGVELAGVSGAPLSHLPDQSASV